MTDNRDSGTLAETEWTGSVENECTSLTYAAAAAVMAEGTSSEEWTEIDQNGFNIWRCAMHFTSLPDGTNCCSNPAEGYPHDVEFLAQIAQSEDANQLQFDNWEPQDGGPHGSMSPETVALNIITNAAGVYFGPYASVASATINFSMGGDTPSVTDQYNESEVNFDIPLDYYGDLPQEEWVDGEEDISPVEISVTVESGYGSGTHTVEFLPKYTFAYTNPFYSCQYDVTYYKTVEPPLLTADFEAT